MNREALKLVATALSLGLAFIALAHFFAFIVSPNEPRIFDVAKASDRELLQRFEHADWPFAVAELTRRTAGYTHQELTELALKVVDAGFWFKSDRQFQTDFFEYNVAFLPKPLADWAKSVGTRRREALASSITKFVTDQQMRAESGEAVDIAGLEHHYLELRKSEHYALFWGPSPGCGFDDRLGSLLMMSIRHTLDSGIPGGAEALARLTP